MIKKTAVRGSDLVSVTFRSTAPEKAATVSLVGQFNDWDPASHPMKLRKDGTWSVTVRLPSESRYEYRYLLDEQEWLTDEQSDGQAVNEFGGTNAVIRT
ncbi:MAG: isoamylase early set domain-containing protein [Planctomycetota bacterium]|jgi:1,4-alpha-glucan branching enzyme